MREFLQTDGARRLLESRYFADEHLELSGVDGIGQVIDVDGLLTAIRFPDRYAGRRDRPDVQLTLHEMGHFATLSEHRIVRDGFGFDGGLPELGPMPWHRFHTRPVSAALEAKAFAWEHILLQDLFGVDIPVRELVVSLRRASDFFCYPGGSEGEKLDWVAAIAADIVVRHRAGAAFDRIWGQRVAALPRLIAAENARMRACGTDPVEVSEPIEIFGSWEARTQRHEFEGTIAWCVVVEDVSNGDSTSREFDSAAAAARWVGRMRDAYLGQQDVVVPAP